MFNPLTYYSKMEDNILTIGGLNFNYPNFNTSYTKINLQNIEKNDEYEKIIQQNQNNCIMKNVGIIINFNMIIQNKIPIIIDKYIDIDIHKKLNDMLKG